MDGALVEAGHAGQVRRRDELPVEVVRPLMIRAENGTPGDHAALHGCTRGVTAVSAAQPRTSMPTDVVERAYGALAIAYYENALTDDIEHQVVPGFRQLLLAGSTQPFTTEDPFFFQLKDLLGVVPSGGQRLLEPPHACSGYILIHHALCSSVPSSYNSEGVGKSGPSRRYAALRVALSSSRA